MTLASLHADKRGNGGKYDAMVDEIEDIPYLGDKAESAGQSYLNWALNNPGKEKWANLGGLYVALDVTTNAGEATVAGAHDLAKDLDGGMVYEITDPIGNPSDILGGMIESVGKNTDYKGVEVLGAKIEGIGEFISDPVLGLQGGHEEEWYDRFMAGGVEGTEPSEPADTTTTTTTTTTAAPETTTETTTTATTTEATTTVVGAEPGTYELSGEEFIDGLEDLSEDEQKALFGGAENYEQFIDGSLENQEVESVRLSYDPANDDSWVDYQLTDGEETVDVDRIYVEDELAEEVLE